MIFGIIIESAVGLLCVILGAVIWKKRKVTLIHDYQYKNVKEEDIPAYCKGMGIGIILVGAGIFITGILNVFESSWWWIPLTTGIVIGLITMHKTQMKYNGSWMSFK